MIIIPRQCKKSSRKVEKKDLKRLKKDAAEMIALCQKPIGRYPGALALAHCQVDHDDPLRFFVMASGAIIINPEIECDEDSLEYHYEREGCLSYPFRSIVKTRRLKKIFGNYETFAKNGKLIKRKDQEIVGLFSSIMQHEIDHFNGIAIYS